MSCAAPILEYPTREAPGRSAVATADPVAALYVSPNPDDQRTLRAIFHHAGWTLHSVETAGEAMAHLRRAVHPLVISDRDLPDGTWVVLLNECFHLPQPPQVVVSSRAADEHLWSVVLNLGGFDLLTVPFDRREVHHVVSHAWNSWNRQHRPTGRALRRAVGV